MLAGMFIVYSERPLALVLAYDTFYSLSAQEFEDYGKELDILQQMPGSTPKLIYTELPENEIQADIIAMRSQFIGDPLFMQTERYRPLPVAGTATVFTQEVDVRASISSELRDQLPEGCLLARFVSSVTGGYVCFDADSMKLTAHFEAELE